MPLIASRILIACVIQVASVVEHFCQQGHMPKPSIPPNSTDVGPLWDRTGNSAPSTDRSSVYTDDTQTSRCQDDFGGLLNKTTHFALESELQRKREKVGIILTHPVIRGVGCLGDRAVGIEIIKKSQSAWDIWGGSSVWCVTLNSVSLSL